MSNYTKTTDFEAKDSLPSGDSGKIIRGSEFETEFDNIATAIASKSDANNPTFTGTVTIDGLTVNGNTVLGNAASDTVTVTADIASNLLPSADDTYNLGAVGAEWNDLYVDGVAYIDTINGFAATGDVNFGDNNKAQFGAGNDLQIFHDGSNSRIKDNGTGGLYVQGSSFISLTNASATETYVYAAENGAVQLKYDNATKLATTSTGIDVTGTVNADGLTVDGTTAFNNNNVNQTGTAPKYNFFESDVTNLNSQLLSSSGKFFIRTLSDDAGTVTKRFQIDHSTGDISFFEDTGTTAKFYWDSSAERLQIGSGVQTINNGANGAFSPNLAHIDDGAAQAGIVVGTGGAKNLRVGLFADDTNNICGISTRFSTGSNPAFVFRDAVSGGNERMRIDSSGNVGIGTDSPAALLNTKGNDALLMQTVASDNYGFHVTVAHGTDMVKLGALDSADGSKDGSTITFGDFGRDIRFSTNKGASLSEAMRITSAGNVGIGESSPDEALVVRGGNYAGNQSGGIALQLGDASGGHYKAAFKLKTASNGVVRTTIDATNGTTGGTVEAISIANATGNVGIGTSSPQGPLQVALSSARNLVVDFDTEGDNRTSLRSIESTANNLRPIQIEGQEIVLGTAAYDQTVSAERMRIDSSGNLLVGKTSTGAVNVGVELNSSGYVTASVAGGEAAYFNRKTSDGAIVQFRKDNSAVGSIGTSTTDLFIGSGVAGLRFREGGPQLMPWNTSANSAYDNAIDIGKSDARWKDLYLSGGVKNSSGIYMGRTDLNTSVWIGNSTINPGDSSGAARDNAIDLGFSSARFDDIYATNGTIQTSDRNEKQDIEELSDAEQRVAVAAKGLLRKFRWKSSVAENGDEARIHFGIIAQDLQDAFAAEGLDAGRYAMFINSTWTDEETGEERSRMGVRYSELLAFIIAAI